MELYKIRQLNHRHQPTTPQIFIFIFKGVAKKYEIQLKLKRLMTQWFFILLSFTQKGKINTKMAAKVFSFLLDENVWTNFSKRRCKYRRGCAWVPCCVWIYRHRGRNVGRQKTLNIVSGRDNMSERRKDKYTHSKERIREKGEITSAEETTQ